MLKKLTNNIGLKIIAILVAAAGWLVIINIDDPSITKTISGIKVEVENEKSIAAAGKCYEIKSGEVLTIVVKGKKSVVDSLSSSDFEAVADLSKYSITNAVPVSVSAVKNYGSNLDIIEGKSNTLMIKLENYVTKQFSLKPKIKGSVAKGYYISSSEISANPNRIEVSGPESIISKVASVRYIVDVTEASEQFSTVCEPAAYDSGGKKLASDKIDFGVDTISASGTPMYMNSVPVKLNVTGQAADGYRIIKSSCTVDKISIASSDKSILKGIEQIDINIDGTGLKEKLKETVSIKDYLPDGVRLVSDDKTADIVVKVEQLKVKDISFDANDVKFSNIMNDVICNYDVDFQMSVSIRGLEAEVDELTIENLVPTIDLSTLAMGTQNAEISFETIDGIEILNKPSLVVSLEKKQEPVPGNADNQQGDNTSDDGASPGAEPSEKPTKAPTAD